MVEQNLYNSDWRKYKLEIKFDKKTLKRLKKAGWYPERQYELDDKYIKELENIGYVYFDLARSIFTSFGALILERAGNAYELDFEIYALDFQSFNVAELKKNIGFNIFPLCVEHQHFVFIGENQKIYSEFGELGCPIANSFEDFINNNY